MISELQESGKNLGVNNFAGLRTIWLVQGLIYQWYTRSAVLGFGFCEMLVLGMNYDDHVSDKNGFLLSTLFLPTWVWRWRSFPCNCNPHKHQDISQTGNYLAASREY